MSSLSRRSRPDTLPGFPLRFQGIHLLLLVFLTACAYLASHVKTPGYPVETAVAWVEPREDQYNVDEFRHVVTAEYMARHQGLPPFETHKQIQLYGVSFHPPLYHALCAVVWALFAPLLGRSGCILLLRLLSALMGAGTVYFAYRTARLLVSRRAALLAAACVAGVPMFVSVSAAVSNENLGALASGISLYYLVYGIRRGFSGRTTLLLSAWIAVGVSSKFTCVGLIPAAWFGLWWAGHKRGVPLALRVQQMAVVGGLSTLAIGWFLIRNLLLYGDLFRLKAWTAYYGGDSDGFASHHLHDHISWNGYVQFCALLAWRSFWGNFDRCDKWLPMRVYSCLYALHGASLGGFGLLWRRGRLRGDRLAAFMAMGIVALVVVAEFYKFNWWHLSPAGRYFFPALTPFAIVTAVGWLALFPRRLRGLACALLLAALLLLNTYVCLKYPAHPIRIETLDPKFL